MCGPGADRIAGCRSGLQDLIVVRSGWGRFPDGGMCYYDQPLITGSWPAD